MDHPKISIVTVTYNSAKTLELSIRSIIDQAYTNLEYIIIDGGSKDGTLDIIKKYERHISKWISEPDKGIYDAMNKGIRMANGEMVAFLNSDDVYLNSPFQTVAETITKNKNISVVFANALMIRDPNPSYIYRSKLPTSINDFWRTPIIHPSMFTRRSEFDRVGLFSTDYRVSGDFDFLVRLFLAKSVFYYHEAVWARMNGGGISDREWATGMHENLKIMRNHNQLTATLIIFFLLNYFKTYCAMTLEKHPLPNKFLRFYRHLVYEKYPTKQ